jgi:hypothetical protein
MLSACTCFPLAGGLHKFYANSQPIQRQLLLVQYKQQANPLLSIHNYCKYTPLVISRNDKNKQLTLLSQRKLAVPRKIHFLQYKIIGAPKNVKNVPVLYLDLKLTIHVIKSQIHLAFKIPFSGNF